MYLFFEPFKSLGESVRISLGMTSALDFFGTCLSKQMIAGDKYQVG